MGEEGAEGGKEDGGEEGDGVCGSVWWVGGKRGWRGGVCGER